MQKFPGVLKSGAPGLISTRDLAETSQLELVITDTKSLPWNQFDQSKNINLEDDHSNHHYPDHSSGSNYNGQILNEAFVLPEITTLSSVVLQDELPTSIGLYDKGIESVTALNTSNTSPFMLSVSDLSQSTWATMETNNMFMKGSVKYQPTNTIHRNEFSDNTIPETSLNKRNMSLSSCSSKKKSQPKSCSRELMNLLGREPVEEELRDAREMAATYETIDNLGLDHAEIYRRELRSSVSGKTKRLNSGNPAGENSSMSSSVESASAPNSPTLTILKKRKCQSLPVEKDRNLAGLNSRYPLRRTSWRANRIAKPSPKKAVGIMENTGIDHRKTLHNYISDAQKLAYIDTSSTSCIDSSTSCPNSPESVPVKRSRSLTTASSEKGRMMEYEKLKRVYQTESHRSMVTELTSPKQTLMITKDGTKQPSIDQTITGETRELMNSSPIVVDNSLDNSMVTRESDVSPNVSHSHSKRRSSVVNKGDANITSPKIQCYVGSDSKQRASVVNNGNAGITSPKVQWFNGLHSKKRASSAGNVDGHKTKGFISHSNNQHSSSHIIMNKYNDLGNSSSRDNIMSHMNRSMDNVMGHSMSRANVISHSATRGNSISPRMVRHSLLNSHNKKDTSLVSSPHNTSSDDNEAKHHCSPKTWKILKNGRFSCSIDCNNVDDSLSNKSNELRSPSYRKQAVSSPDQNVLDLPSRHSDFSIAPSITRRGTPLRSWDSPSSAKESAYFTPVVITTTDTELSDFAHSSIKKFRAGKNKKRPEFNNNTGMPGITPISSNIGNDVLNKRKQNTEKSSVPKARNLPDTPSGKKRKQTVVTPCGDNLKQIPTQSGAKKTATETPNKVANKQTLQLGSLGWSRLGLQRYWPCMVINHDLCGQQKAKENHTWVYWFGDHKVSKVSSARIVPFAEEYNHKVSKNFSQLFKKALLEAIELCGQRADISIHKNSPCELLEWAADGFRIEGTSNYDKFLPNNEYPIPDTILANLYQIKNVVSEVEEEIEAERPFMVEKPRGVLHGQKDLKAFIVELLFRSYPSIAWKKKNIFLFKITDYDELCIFVSLQFNMNIYQDILLYHLYKFTTKWRNNVFQCMSINHVQGKRVMTPCSVRLNALNISSLLRGTQMAISIGTVQLIRELLGDAPYETIVPDKRLYHYEGALMEVHAGKTPIEDVCIACDKKGNVVIQHPLFQGGLCKDCKSNVKDTLFSLDDEGIYAFCAVCGNGGKLFVCDSCSRVYCCGCLATMINPASVQMIKDSNPWVCFMCVPIDTEITYDRGLFHVKPQWEQNIWQLFNVPFGLNVTQLNPEEITKKPLRVLSLFDGIGSGLVALKKLDIKIGRYYTSEIDTDAIKVVNVHHGDDVINLGDINDLTVEKLKEILPIDLVIGGSPCNELSIANPQRKGLTGGTGLLFFEFYRIISQMTRICDSHIFWLFENVVGMPHECKKKMSTYFMCDPIMLDARAFSAQTRKRYFWGNIPGMYCPPQILHNKKTLSSSLMQGRTAQVDALRTVTTRSNSLMQGRNEDIFPVYSTVDGMTDTIWTPELEKLFGYPEHYTDVGNFSATKRQKLLGKGWSIPVIVHILRPLQNFFEKADS